MVLIVLAYLGGVLTIVSPCILPVLPFVFARSDQPFRKSGLPLLGGMVVTFAVVASLATVGGGWAVRANEFGRVAALVLFALFGLTLLFSSLAERLSRPLVRMGNRLSQPGDGNAGKSSVVLKSFLLGIGTGLLWAPCAGPILGLILTGAALGGASGKTVVLLVGYAAGAATSLMVALLAGGRVFAAMKRSLGAEEWIRRALGVLVLAAVVAVALGLDRGVLTRLSLGGSTGGLEQRLVDKFHGSAAASEGAPVGMAAAAGADGVPTVLPDLSGATAWIGSSPLTAAGLRGKVVLVDFWTYSCINCLRTLPYIKAWNAKYKDSGLVIIGVHTPEFPFEKNEANVRKAVADLGVTYPVAMDNDYAIWRAFHNQYWPADYFIDAKGRVRAHHFGEGGYDEADQWIRSLLEEANGKPLGGSAEAAPIAATGALAATDAADVHSPETYLGYARGKSFASPGGMVEDEANVYRLPAELALNEWGFAGKWTDGRQTAVAGSAGAAIAFRFHARDLHLVLGLAGGGASVRFRVTIDGRAPGADHGVDVDAAGNGVVTENRLYQLIRQQGAIGDHTFRIEFLGVGAEAFAFTFG